MGLSHWPLRGEELFLVLMRLLYVSKHPFVGVLNNAMVCILMEDMLEEKGTHFVGEGKGGSLWTSREHRLRDVSSLGLALLTILL